MPLLPALLLADVSITVDDFLFDTYTTSLVLSPSSISLCPDDMSDYLETWEGFCHPVRE